MSTESLLYTLSDNTLTFYSEAGKSTQVFKDHPKFAAIVQAVKDGDHDAAVEMARPVATITAQVAGVNDDLRFRRAAGKIEVTDWGVTLDGKGLSGVVIDRLLEVLKLGLPVDPWVNFVRKLHQNPSSVSRAELYLWLEKAGMPITPDGDFLAYKKVQNNYKDVHSGTFNNSVGSVCEMSRLDVDDDRNRTCSAGLHFCSKGYLSSFSGSRIMVLKINPADVVSIPSDYNDTKGRTWRYEVVGEIGQDAYDKSWGPISNDYPDYDDFEEDDDEYDDDDDSIDADDEAPRVLIGQVFAAYAQKFPGVSKDGTEKEVRLLRASAVLKEELESFNDLTAGQAYELIAAW